jgi:hypothetical protein
MAIRIVAEPVVYTNNAGGGGELQAPTNGENFMDFAAGGNVAAAWYVPYDNLGDFGAIHRIAVEPNGSQVRLRAAGLPGNRDSRVRIRIYAEV